MRNRKQLAAAFVLAAILGTAMPLSADMGGAKSSTCAVVMGMAEKALPAWVADMLWAKWCDGERPTTASE
jgi:hypothetical protein